MDKQEAARLGLKNEFLDMVEALSTEAELGADTSSDVQGKPEFPEERIPTARRGREIRAGGLTG